MAKTKQKREILDPAIKGTISRSVLKAKVGAIPRVVTTDLVPGDRVSVFVLATREKVAGNVVAVFGQGQNKRIRIDIIGDGRVSHREFRIADCRITKIGRRGTTKATLGFLKGVQYAKPGVKVGQVFRTKPRGEKK